MTHVDLLPKLTFINDNFASCHTFFALIVLMQVRSCYNVANNYGTWVDDVLSFITSYRQHDLACDFKSAAIPRKKNAKLIFISNLFTFCQLKFQIYMVGLNNILILIFQVAHASFSKYLKFKITSNY